MILRGSSAKISGTEYSLESVVFSVEVLVASVMFVDVEAWTHVIIHGKDLGLYPATVTNYSTLHSVPAVLSNFHSRFA